MSFLSGIMGGGKGNNMVDQAVDKVADVAKVKVKEMLGGDTTKEGQKGSEAGGAGVKEGGSGASANTEPGSAGGGGGGFDLTDTLGDIAGEIAADKKDDNKPADQLLSFGKSLFG